MLKVTLCLLASGLLVAPALAQPREWSDDFTAAATYDSASVVAPCYGGPVTKYTVIEALAGDIFNARLVSGGGNLFFTDRDPVIPPLLPGRVYAGGVGWIGLGIGCPGEPAPLTFSEAFTSDNLCIYGGFRFNHWQLKVSTTAGFSVLGPDGVGGVAGVDDDSDGTTDEDDETPVARVTAVGAGYGNGDLGFPAGQDNAPGAAGVDDDGNGVTDDIGETGWPGTDDGDDISRHILWWFMDVNLGTSETVFIEQDLGTSGDLFNIRENQNLASIVIENNNEISAGFYQPDTCYNLVFCSSGTCYGAMLWTQTDMANPNETLGPVIETDHTGPADNGVGFGFVHNTTSGGGHHLRRMNVKGNANFSHTFWVVSGDPQTFFPSPSADLDGDRDVDGTDFLTFSNCFNGALNPPSVNCPNAAAALDADLDGDNDVDGTDFLTFSNCFNGALNRPDPFCFPPNLTACP